MDPHTNLVVERPAPGHVIISNLPMSRIQTDGGTIVAPGFCHITPDVPIEILQEIIDGRTVEVYRPVSAPAEPVVVENEELLAKIIIRLMDGTTRIGELSEALEVEPDAIKALAGNGFVIASGGWCKLATETEEGEE